MQIVSKGCKELEFCKYQNYLMITIHILLNVGCRKISQIISSYRAATNVKQMKIDNVMKLNKRNNIFAIV